MKQVLEYYYSINIDELNNENDNYYFKYQNESYYFCFCFRSEEEIDDIINCQNELVRKGVKTGIIIINNFHKYITTFEETKYILFKISSETEILELEDLLDFQNKTILLEDKKRLYRTNWSELWSSKIDYIESQQDMINNNIIIHSALDYYIGLTENAIYFVRKLLPSYINESLVLSHKRTAYPNYALNFYNPLNYIFDLEVRDVAEYLKCEFFISPEETIKDLSEYLQIKHLSIYSLNMLYARLIYPSYFWDEYEKVINKKKNEIDLLKIINKSNEYETFLKKAYKEISLYAPLEKIAWLI